MKNTWCEPLTDERKAQIHQLLHLDQAKGQESLRMVAANYVDGSIDLDALAENVLAVWAEQQRG